MCSVCGRGKGTYILLLCNFFPKSGNADEEFSSYSFYAMIEV